MNYSHRVQKNSSKSPVLPIHTRAAANKCFCCCNPIFTVCEPTADSPLQSLLAPRIVGGSTGHCMIRAPGIPLFLSRARRGAQEREEAGKQPPDAHIDAHAHWLLQQKLLQPAKRAWDPLSLALSLSLSFFLSFSCTCICERECTGVLNVHACVWLRVWTLYVCTSARFCRGWGSWTDRRTAGASVCRSAPLSLSPTLSALKLLQELAQSDLLMQTELG